MDNRELVTRVRLCGNLLRDDAVRFAVMEDRKRDALVELIERSREMCDALEALEAEREMLRGALRFYAEPRTWEEYDDEQMVPELYPEDEDNPKLERAWVRTTAALEDGGKLARRVLGEEVVGE